MRPRIYYAPLFLDSSLRKKKVENTGCLFAELALKCMFRIHFKKVGAIISSEILVNARAIYETISSSNGFFWWSVTAKAWIPSAIHYIQPFHYCRNIKSYRTEANFRGTSRKL